MNIAALKDLLYRLADDKLILGHRNSEWIGFGPILEEDIAFASMAQDKVGQSLAFYQMLHELGEQEPDTIAFTRTTAEFRCCHFVELPIGDYAFSLVRHYLFDLADMIRLRHLAASSYKPLAELATKLFKEGKYHLMHGRVFMKQLGNGTEESRMKMQTALNEALPYAYSLFEPTIHTEALALAGVQPLEDELMKEWQTELYAFLPICGLRMPNVENFIDHFGGRKGYHTEYLPPLVKEMTEVFAIDPEATW